MFQRILIANRGEIAVRIIRACRELGIETVAIYSEADKDALHTQLADYAVCVGPSRVRDSYLNMKNIISAALLTGANAIHPGFGFLSENGKFAEICEHCNIKFIGPSAEIIGRMGNKSEARKAMIRAGVPVVPGSEEPIISIEESYEVANNLGYPIILKAVSGGGGKGMRVVHTKEELGHMFRMASEEAQNAFGDARIYMEKYIRGPRHIEFQILADQHGNVLHLGERDCSLQRRHQKIIEEAPSPQLTPKLREEMGQIAVKAAKAIGYENAGTIEFLLDRDGAYYFMEMNTRIQVEHPITEMVTGIDLIKEQIKISRNEPLSIDQEDIFLTGHAIECRINAEDPKNDFTPSPGKITTLHIPGGHGVRMDTAIYNEYEIPPFYDAMLGKLIVHGKNRMEAIQKMRSALGELIIEGVATNIDFQYELLHHETFVQGEADINFIEDCFL